LEHLVNELRRLAGLGGEDIANDVRALRRELRDLGDLLCGLAVSAILSPSPAARGSSPTPTIGLLEPYASDLSNSPSNASSVSFLSSYHSTIDRRFSLTVTGARFA